jgi:hypothetical protein
MQNSQIRNITLCLERKPFFLDDYLISLSMADVSQSFKQVNNHKAAGPDGMSGRVLEACADQLASVFTDIFNLSLAQSVIPTCFKLATNLHTTPTDSQMTQFQFHFTLPFPT